MKRNTFLVVLLLAGVLSALACIKKPKADKAAKGKKAKTEVVVAENAGNNVAIVAGKAEFGETGAAGKAELSEAGVAGKVMTSKKPAAENVLRLVVCDSTNSLLSGVKMEFLEVNSIPIVSGYDGLITYIFPENVTSVKVMLSGRDCDTLKTTLSREKAGGFQWIVLKKRSRTHGDDIYYTVGTPMGGVKYSREMLTSRKTSPKEVEVETMAIAEDAAVMEATDKSIGMPSPVRPEPAANNLQAGKLTAGEVNDFAKWHLWSRILEQSHAQYINTWRMRVRERYRVQVTNTQQFPLVDAEVELVDAAGKTIFAGRTDNTGHAELWANVVNVREGEPTMIVCRHHGQSDTLMSPQLFPKENVFVLNEACGTPENVDVFFIMDATGSMGDELRYMNAELQDVISRSGSAVQGTVIRTGALVYRDHSDDYLNRLSPLTEDLSVTQAFLNAQRAGGGGDYEEAVPEALMAAINVAGWSKEARARIAFLILDAPCHEDSATIALLHGQVLSAAAQGIRVVPVVCSGLREAGELLMRELSLLTNGTSFFLTDDSGIGDKHLKPTTDSLKVEHLNDMLVRTIIEFASMPDCDEQWADEAVEPNEEEAFIPNPFSKEDLDTVPTTLPERPLDEVLTVRPNPCKDYFLVDLPLGSDAAYVVDLTGKTLQVLGSVPAETRGMSVNVGGYATGVYFVKAFVEGHWYTRKVIVR